MTFEAFLSKIKALGISVRTDPFQWNYWERRGEEKRVLPEYISISWSTGGVSGGSRWDSSSPQPYTSSDTEPEFSDLDMILEEFKPEITYLQYKNLAAAVIESDSYTESEYYENCTNYAIKKIELKRLFDYMQEKSWVK